MFDINATTLTQLAKETLDGTTLIHNILAFCESEARQGRGATSYHLEEREFTPFIQSTLERQGLRVHSTSPTRIKVTWNEEIEAGYQERMQEERSRYQRDSVGVIAVPINPRPRAIL